MNIILVGFGNVGRGLVHMLHEKRSRLQADYGFQPNLVAVFTSRGGIYQPDGLNLAHLLQAAERGDILSHYPEQVQHIASVEALLQAGVVADVLVEASPTNLATGEPALTVCRLALQHSLHVVAANKGPIALDYLNLAALAQQVDRKLLFEGTVMAGTPSLRLAREALAGCTITAARGILNGTTNYILTRMETGLSYEDALAEAQAAGYAETDPSGDVDGWDAAGKVLILAAALFGKQLRLADLQVTGITGITSADVEAVRVAGERWKLIAEITPEGGSVSPVRLPLTDPLAGVSGATNAITYQTDLLGAITLMGAGAGRIETGFALLSDLLAIHRQRR